PLHAALPILSAADPPWTTGTSSVSTSAPRLSVSPTTSVQGSETVESIRTDTCAPATGSPDFDEMARRVSVLLLPGRSSSAASRTSTRCSCSASVSRYSRMTWSRLGPLSSARLAALRVDGGGGDRLVAGAAGNGRGDDGVIE